MTPERLSEARASLIAWLRNEQRLGVAHWPIPAADFRAAIALARSGPALASRGVEAMQRLPVAVAAPSTPPVPAAARATARPPTLGFEAAPTAGEPVALVDRELSESDAQAALQQLDLGYVRACQKCRLCEQRKTTVFGVGRARPEVVFIGEGPGADEDREGVPFVGRAGQLLTRMIAAMTLTRDQVYICNVVKCRPPENRTPEDDEIAACSPYLFQQLAILRPRVIVALGRPASQSLLATRESISRLRGRLADFPPPALAGSGLPPCKLMPTFHPAYLLRAPQEKAKAWDDLQEVMRYLNIPIPKRAE